MSHSDHEDYWLVIFFSSLLRVYFNIRIMLVSSLEVMRNSKIVCSLLHHCAGEVKKKRKLLNYFLKEF